MTKNLGQIYTANPKTIPLDTDIIHPFRPTEPVDTLKDYGILISDLLAAERARLDALEAAPPVTGYVYQFVAANVATTSVDSYVAPSGGPVVVVQAGNTGKIIVRGKFQVRNNSVGNSVVVTVADGSPINSNHKGAVCIAAHHASHANDSESIVLEGVLEGYEPGEEVTLTTVFMTDSGGQAEMKERFLSAQPLYE